MVGLRVAIKFLLELFLFLEELVLFLGYPTQIVLHFLSFEIDVAHLIEDAIPGDVGVPVER